MIIFLGIAAGLTIGAVVAVALPMLKNRSEDSSAAGAVAAALLVPVAAALMYATVSNYPWADHNAGGSPSRAETAASAAPDSNEISALKSALSATPDDPRAWRDLADAFLGAGRFPEAREAYQQAIRLSGGGDDELRLSLAEADILIDRNALLGAAGLVIEELLRRSPSNPKALWYGGMAALEKGDVDTAKERWGLLLEMSPPPRVRQILEQQIAAIANDSPKPSDAFSLPVRIILQDKLTSSVKPGASVFLIARDANAQPGLPPAAVVRRPAGEWPLVLAIGNADAMIPGRNLGDLTEIVLTARISNSGDAMPRSGDLFGEVNWQRPMAGQDQETVVIRIDRVVEQ